MCKIISFFCAMFLTSLSIIAQGSLGGKITDDKGMPLVGATVVVGVPTLGGATTDLEGVYLIENIEAGEHEVLISFVGYSTFKTKAVIKENENTVLDAKIAEDALQMDEVVVTGAFDKRTKLESSVAITTLDAKAIEQRSPRSTADLLTAVPGTYVESATGEVGAVIYARGLSSGLQAQPGYQYVSLQEDGLPVLSTQFNFSSVDMYHRADLTTERLEAIRGGSASVASANAPGGLFNFISKEGGLTPAGAFELKGGVQGNGSPYLRADLNWGSPLNKKGWFYNIGGFYRYDKGARLVPYVANNGGQLKMNVSKKHDKGFLKIYGKFLSDQVTAFQYLPYTNLHDRQVLNSFDAHTSSIYPTIVATDIPDGTRFLKDNTAKRSFDSRKGITALDATLGFEFLHSLGKDWLFRNNFKYSYINQNYFQFAGNIALPTADGITKLYGLEQLFSDGYIYQDFTTKEVLFDKEKNINTIGDKVFLAAALNAHNRIHDFIDQFSFSKEIKKHQISVGSYISYAAVKVNWSGDGIISTLEAKPRLFLISHPNFIDSNKPFQFTDPRSGMLSYGAQVYNNSQGSSATGSFFITDLWKFNESLTVDAAIRGEIVAHNGKTEKFDLSANRLPSYLGLFPEGTDRDYTTFYDAGVKLGIDSFENWNFKYPYMSASLGVNYRFNEGIAAYIRATRGNKAPELAYYFSNFVNEPIRKGKTEEIYMGELGVKIRNRKYALSITGFYSEMDNVSFQLLVPGKGGEVIFTPSTFNNIRTVGTEIEAFFNPIKNFTTKIIATLQDPRYLRFTYYNLNGTADNKFVNPATGEQNKLPNGQANGSDDFLEDFSGNLLSEVPRVMVDITPTYKFARLEVFMNWRYTGERQANRRNTIQLPGFHTINAGLSSKITKRVEASLSINNLFNVAGQMSFDGMGVVGLTSEDYAAGGIRNPKTAQTIPNTDLQVLEANKQPAFIRPSLPRAILLAAKYIF